MNPTANKRKGARFETALVEYLRQLGYGVERLRLNGVEDEGDLVIDMGDYHIIVEAKDVASPDLSGPVSESQAEADNYCKHRGIDRRSVEGIVVKKRRNRPIGQSYVITTLDEYLGGRA